jgi:fermentation-respiration switch protein FrsA (DUF1100 family)
VIVIRQQLANRSDYSNEAENQGVNPTRAASKTMAAANDDGGDQRRNEDDQLDHRNPTAGVDVHSNEYSLVEEKK